MIRRLMIRRLALAASLALASASVFATTYTLEPDYTQGVFRWITSASPARPRNSRRATARWNTTKAIPPTRPWK